MTRGEGILEELSDAHREQVAEADAYAEEIRDAVDAVATDTDIAEHWREHDSFLDFREGLAEWPDAYGVHVTWTEEPYVGASFTVTDIYDPLPEDTPSCPWTPLGADPEGTYEKVERVADRTAERLRKKLSEEAHTVDDPSPGYTSGIVRYRTDEADYLLIHHLGAYWGLYRSVPQDE